jgi:hypothetical protein
MLVNPSFPSTAPELRDVQAAALSLGMDISALEASTSGEIDAAFATFASARPHALFVGGDPFLLGQREKIVSLSAGNAVPTTYPQREYVEAGGLMSYGATPIGKPPFTSGGFSRARNRATCRSCSRISSNWSSISGLRRRLVSKSRPRSSLAPTR